MNKLFIYINANRKKKDFCAKCVTLCRYSLSDPKAQSIVKLITESVQVENLRFLFNLPWTRHLFPEATGWNSQKKITKDVQDLVKELVDEHKGSFFSEAIFMSAYES